MNVFTLLLIAAGAAFSIIYLVASYVPLQAKFLGKRFSPRLMVCKLLAPADAIVTIFLVAGTWVGLSVTVTGISTIIYNVLSGLGFSAGVLILKKYFVPRWRLQLKEAQEK